jgi:cation diffusion facilitator CzcD-associated flavoprotein CzcO
MSDKSVPSVNDARTIAQALRGVAMAVEMVQRNHSSLFSEMNRELINELAHVLRWYATDLEAAAAKEEAAKEISERVDYNR